MTVAAKKESQPLHSYNPVVSACQDVLADTYGLYLATHNYHWNVEGENFFQLHQLFQVQYEELFEAIDVIAEHIRTMDAYALPFEGENILHVLKTISNPLNKEIDGESRANRMIDNLVALNEAVIASCQKAKEECQDAEDDETEDMLIARIRAHQKAAWMLASLLK